MLTLWAFHERVHHNAHNVIHKRLPKCFSYWILCRGFETDHEFSAPLLDSFLLHKQTIFHHLCEYIYLCEYILNAWFCDHNRTIIEHKIDNIMATHDTLFAPAPLWDWSVTTALTETVVLVHEPPLLLKLAQRALLVAAESSSVANFEDCAGTVLTLYFTTVLAASRTTVSTCSNSSVVTCSKQDGLAICRMHAKHTFSTVTSDVCIVMSLDPSSCTIDLTTSNDELASESECEQKRRERES